MRRWRRNPDNLTNLENQFRLNPTLENRAKLIREAVAQGQTEYLNGIFKEQEQPVLGLLEEFRSGQRRYYSLHEGIFDRFFEKIYPELPYPPSSDDLTDYEQHQEAHLVSEIKFNIPGGPAPRGRTYPARELSVSFFRTPTTYLLRILDYNLDERTFMVEYLEKPADRPLFEGWRRFLSLKGETWDIPIETGTGGPTEEEQRQITSLGYYGQEINENTIIGLEARKPFRQIAQGQYRFSIEALDGKSENWFQTRQEAIEYVRKFPGLRLSETSWLDEYFGDRKFFIETLADNVPPITYEEIFES